VPGLKGQAEDDEPEEDEEGPEPHKPPAPRASPKSEAAPAKCATHHAPGLDRHVCGAWLCRACIEAGGMCAECDSPLTTASDHEARKKDREADFGRL